MYSLVNAHLGNTSTSEDEEIESASSEEASDVAVAEAEQTSENEEVVALTEDQCIELKSLKKPVALGDINYCQIYGIDVLDQSDTSIQKRKSSLVRTL